MTTQNTVRLHRVLTASSEKIYHAFLDPDALAQWIPPNGFTARVHHMDAKARAAIGRSSVVMQSYDNKDAGDGKRAET